MVTVLVLLTFFVFIVAGVILHALEQRRRALTHGPAAVSGVLARGAADTGPAVAPAGVAAAHPAAAFAAALPPTGTFVDRGHTWLGLEPFGAARVGMDDFAGSAIGRVDRVDLPPVGRFVCRGEVLFTIRQGERAAEFAAPIDGVVSGVNEELLREPGLLRADPYAKGWVCSILPRSLARGIRRLLVAEEATEWIATEIERLRALFSAPRLDAAAGAVSPDGGSIRSGVLEHADGEKWDLFVQEFLVKPVIEG